MTIQTIEELDCMKLLGLEFIPFWQGRIEEFNCSFSIAYALDKGAKECDVLVTVTYPEKSHDGVGVFGISIDIAQLLIMIKDGTFIAKIKSLYLKAEQEYATAFCKTKH